MPRPSRFHFVLLAFSLATALRSAVAQDLIATVPTGQSPYAVAVNPVTNKIYVTNLCGDSSSCVPTPPGTVTVIDGATNDTTTVTVGVNPQAIAVNPVTNQIYVANGCGNDPQCLSPNGTVTVIDGATNQTTTITVGNGPDAVGVNSVTNKIYVPNLVSDDVTIIDGATDHTTTVAVGTMPGEAVVNMVTNKIYVLNSCGDSSSCVPTPPGTVTVIDGADNHTETVTVGYSPGGTEINSLTNKIYVGNSCGNDTNCNSPGTVTVIDGANNTTTTLNSGYCAGGGVVNEVTNRIYLINGGDDPDCFDNPTITIIDGATNNILANVNLGGCCFADINVDAPTNKIYLSIDCGTPNCTSPGTVRLIDGVTNTLERNPVTVGVNPADLEINATTNRIYVSNSSSNTASVVAGAADSTALQFAAVVPCRLVDTRQGNPIAGGTSRSFQIPQLGCGIPSSAAAFSLNVTVVPHTTLGYLTIWPAGEDQPVLSTMNSPDGRVKAHAAIVPEGYQGAVSVYVSDTTDVLLDIDGYFTTPGAHTYQFYALTPCRIVDTRNGHDGGTLQAGVERDYSISGHCGVPSNAAAYSFNVTVLPTQGELDYLTVWPKGETRPGVSTLDDNTGTVVANAAIVPAGSEHATAFYPHSNNTDLLLDVNGYFAPAGTGGLSMYPTAPCRVLDTRAVGNGQPFTGEKTVNVGGSVCAPPATAKGYIFNATVVPRGQMPYLTLWPHGEGQPTATTLNAYDGFITSNMAIVPTLDGSIDAYAAGLTQLILDISGYFAP